MRRSMRAAALALFALCAAHPALRAQLSARGANVIAGVVVSAASGQPLQGADVTLQDTNGFQQLAGTTTGADGSFSFPNVPNGKFILSASHRGYVNSTYEEHDGAFTAVVTGEGQVTTGLTLSLEPLGAIFGRVTEDSGDPVPNAGVRLYRRARVYGAEGVQFARMDNADAMGNFEIPHLAPGDYYLCATGTPWYRPMQSNVTRATNASRSPLDVAYPLSCYPDTSDPAGAEAITVNAGDRVEADLTMHPLPALHIFVQVPKGNHRGGIRIPQLRQDVFGMSTPVTFASENWPAHSPDQGNGQGTDQGTMTVEITGIPPGQYNIQLQGPNPSQDPARIGDIVLSSSDLNLDAASLSPMASVSGTVTVAGAGRLPTECSISLIPEQGGPGGNAAVTANGTFRIPAVAPGAYDVIVGLKNQPMLVTQLRASGGTISDSLLKVGSDPVRLTVLAANPIATISGVVTRNGKPASGVFALLVPEKLNGSRYAWQPNQSDSDGSVTFDRIAPGTYTAVAIDKGWTLDWRRPEVISRYLAGGVRITVGPNVTKLQLNSPIEAQSIDTPSAPR